MILRPFLHAEPVAISYLFGCGSRASGAVVDPVGDIEPYLRTAEEGARVLFASLGRLKALPGYVEVLPGAFSGSVCGRSLSGKPFSTIGFERRHNAAFRIDEEAAFVRFMSADIPVPPPGAAELRAVNAGLAA